MQYGIAFTPLVPSLVLWIAIGSIAVIAGLLLLARPRGAVVRIAALALIVLEVWGWRRRRVSAGRRRSTPGDVIPRPAR